jgi:ABC-type antimicrobial peptide transport system permease subunit
MFGGYTKMALHSIGRAKWRSFLTMLGVVIGVISVVTIVSLGEGVRQQITRQINQAGSDLITIRPGHLINRNDKGAVSSVRLLNLLGSGSLSEADVANVQKVSGLQLTVPFGYMNGVPEANGRTDSQALLIGTSDQAAQALNQKIKYGVFFETGTGSVIHAVLGQRVAQELFNENAPIGRSFTIRGQTAIVVGVFDDFDNNPLAPGLDYNHSIFLSYDFAKNLAGGQLQIYQILVRPAQGQTVTQTVERLTAKLKAAHGGQTDFTVLHAEDNLAIAGSALTLLTGLIAGIAAISLIVGGIGIMNIMLVSVSERTHEIGVRKSVGATNQQILGQFLTEALVLSAVGGIIGVIASLILNYLLRIWTTLEPAISFAVMVYAVLVALGVGMIFGITPAIKAARKDPIEALRRI